MDQSPLVALEPCGLAATQHSEPVLAIFYKTYQNQLCWLSIKATTGDSTSQEIIDMQVLQNQVQSSR